MLHVDIPTLAEFKALAATRSDACVSLYVPTSPLGGKLRANRIVFKDLAKSLSQLKAAGSTEANSPHCRGVRLLSGTVEENHG